MVQESSEMVLLRPFLPNKVSHTYLIKSIVTYFLTSSEIMKVKTFGFIQCVFCIVTMF